MHLFSCAGESLFNDGVGVVVFLAIASLIPRESVGVLEIAWLFVGEALGGALLGLVLGYAAYVMLKSVDNYRVGEVAKVLKEAMTTKVRGLKVIVAGAGGMVVIACFSSHIHRVQQVIDAARASERVVAFLGRSMLQSTAAARRLGLLHVDDRDVVGIEEVGSLDPARVVVACTGSQGEPYSALSLMAAGEHKHVKLGAGDTVVLSSSLIPGNEPAIHRVVDGLYRTGADVFHVPAAAVHASGHASAEELRLMLSLVKPRWFIPVHGERRHLSHHAKKIGRAHV